MDDLKRQNTHLEAQIRALERAKSLGNFSSVADILNESGLVRTISTFSTKVSSSFLESFAITEWSSAIRLGV